MGKLFLAIWIFLSSLVGVKHLPPTIPAKAVVSIIPTSEIPKPSKLPNKLMVTRPEDKTDHLSALTVTITDEAKVRKLYEDIIVLPTFAPGRYNCPMANFSKYLLDFYLINTLISHGVFTPTGCSNVKLDKFNARVDWHQTFASDLQQALGINGKDFYGYQR